jgi:hypothetical protein
MIVENRSLIHPAASGVAARISMQSSLQRTMVFENHILYGRFPSDRLNSSLSCCSVVGVLGQVIRWETQSV